MVSNVDYLFYFIIILFFYYLFIIIYFDMILSSFFYFLYHIINLMRCHVILYKGGNIWYDIVQYYTL